MPETKVSKPLSGVESRKRTRPDPTVNAVCHVQQPKLAVKIESKRPCWSAEVGFKVQNPPRRDKSRNCKRSRITIVIANAITDNCDPNHHSVAVFRHIESDQQSLFR